jgi:hypothetical protein
LAQTEGLFRIFVAWLSGASLRGARTALGTALSFGCLGVEVAAGNASSSALSPSAPNLSTEERGACFGGRGLPTGSVFRFYLA